MPITYFSRSILFSVSAIAILVFFPTPVQGATGTVINFENPQQTVQKYQKYEVTFDLSKEYPNPYYFYDPSDTRENNPDDMTWVGEDGVSVDAIITAPSGKQLTLPAFYYQDFKRIKVGDRDILGKYKKPVWKFRFAPSETGTYSYYLTVKDKEGSTRYPQNSQLSFSATDSASKGFIKVSQHDSRFMEYEDGDTFVPISRGEPWVRNYEALFEKFKNYRVNFVRIWDQNDFALGVEGAQTNWVSADTTDGAARGVTIGSGAHQGLRSATPNPAWYQRVAIAEPNRVHKIEGYVKGSGRVRITGVQSNLLIDSTITETSAGSGSDWTYVSTTFTPGRDRVAIYLPTGASYDQIAFGPVDTQGNIEYNIVSDGDFERHFAKDNPGNDPNQNVDLPRPLGNFFNQEDAYQQDKYIEAAERNDVYIQLCSCSGPWFTWPANPESPDVWDWSQKWVLNSWNRNFRYRVARWGYSTSIVAWENHNELGHVTPNTALYDFHIDHAKYQEQVDIYQHLKTTSQGSQSFSPNFWSSEAFDLANYHDYMMSSRYPAVLNNDGANFVSKLAWCIGTKGTYCAGLGLGDGSQWIANAPYKPWVWGEIGVGTTEWNQPNPKGTTGEGARRALKNTMWSGLLSPIATVPIPWYDNEADTSYSNTAYAERKVAADFFQGANLSRGNVTFVTTTADRPEGYTGESITSSEQKLRVYGAIYGNKKRAYLWVQHRDHTWFNAPTLPSAVSGSITIPNMLNEEYTVEVWNTNTGEVINTRTVTPTNGSLQFGVSNLNSDVAVKVLSKTDVPPISMCTRSDINSDGTVDLFDYTILIGNFFSSVANNSSDINQDGVVDLTDYSILVKNFLQSCV